MKTVRKLQLMVAAKRFNQILKKLETPDVFLVHLPCKLAGFTEKINFKGPRIAVLHNSDLLKLKKKKVHVSYIEQNFIALGFRSLSIQRRFEEISRHKKKTFLVYSGAPDLGDVAQIKRKNKNGVHFLYVGKLIPLKKVDMILNALARFGQKHQFHFTIIGDGEQMPYLKKLAETLSLEKRITFCGELDRKIVFSKMAETDVFVMVSSPETFGLVYIEAMSFGCITIGTKNEGIDGVIRNGENGFLVPAGDEKMLLKCFERIVELNDQDYERISRNAMLTAANMTEEKVAENYLTNVSAICSFSSGSRK
jgi:glycosyltransferase involved in cell wall biosynthesis